MKGHALTAPCEATITWTSNAWWAVGASSSTEAIVRILGDVFVNRKGEEMKTDERKEVTPQSCTIKQT